MPIVAHWDDQWATVGNPALSPGETIVETCDKPMAIRGLVSYRYRGRYGWIMIGATDNDDALREARRSTEDQVSIDRLERWNGSTYEAAQS